MYAYHMNHLLISVLLYFTVDNHYSIRLSMLGNISGTEPLPMARDTSSKEQIRKHARTSPLRTYVLHIGIILVIDVTFVFLP